MDQNRKFLCALEPFTYAIAIVLVLNVVSLFCDCLLALYIGGFLTCCLLCKSKFPERDEFEIAVRSCGLGVIFAIGLSICIYTVYWRFGLYLCALSFFHWSEFATLAYVNSARVTIDAFMLSHSLEYSVAAVSSWLEFFVEQYVFPDMKCFCSISLIGLVFIIVGETIRKLAILHLGSNFTHVIQVVPLENHQLVTRGLYSYIRHPSYTGWYIWSIGTQLLMLNPFCVVAYAITAWLFFRERIETEEMLLIHFFGLSYVAYRQNTISGLPFIKGYEP